MPSFVKMPLVRHLIRRAQPMLAQGERFGRFVEDERNLKHISPVWLATLASILRYAVRTRRFAEGVFLMPQKKRVPHRAGEFVNQSPERDDFRRTTTVFFKPSTVL